MPRLTLSPLRPQNLAFGLALMACLVSGESAAGVRAIRAEGRAAIAGNDIAGARKSALAEALYDAALQVRARVRGGSHLSTQGVLTEESSIVAEGLIKGYQVTDEHREGTRYVVRIEALADSGEDTCSEGKRTDLDVRAINVRVAPGLPGSVNRMARESISRGIASLAGSSVFRAVDNRDVASARGDARTDYTSLMTAAFPSQAGYTASGSMTVEIQRGDTLLGNVTEISASLTLHLRDDYAQSKAQTLTQSIRIPYRNRIWGTETDFGTAAAVDFTPLWQAMLTDLEKVIGCQPLRAKVLAAEGSFVTLSVGSEHGVKTGDYFLVELPGKKARTWQLLTIQTTTPTFSTARLMKPSPAVPVNALAVMMQ
jgi:hypothetical protein